MPTVSNTSPLLNLAIVDQLSLLEQQFETVWVPQAVIEELRVKESLPGSQAIREAIEEGWLLVEPVQDQMLVQALQRDLDKGEAEAIALCVHMGANRVLLDEREGRRIAKSLGLQVTGVLGVLLRAKRKGRLLALRTVMDQLRDQAGFHIGQELFVHILREGGEM